MTVVIGRQIAVVSGACLLKTNPSLELNTDTRKLRRLVILPDMSPILVAFSMAIIVEKTM